MEKTFPKEKWEIAEPSAIGFDPDRFAKAKIWFDKHSDYKNYRCVIIRRGYVVAEYGTNADRKFRIASAAKSIYSNVLGIAISEGKIPSADAKVCDYYPEMMDVPDGRGPKPDRYAFEKDRDITFRQLISNTSGYMKPNENPGKVFHYQTYGMNILTHSIAKIYGYYDINDPENSTGFQQLIRKKITDQIGADLDYSLTNFQLWKQAKLNIFGHYCQIHTTSSDFARIGWLWCNWGKWEDRQIIDPEWLRESVKVERAIVENCPEAEWKYGMGFWTNEKGQLWSDLPTNGFTASGAGGHYLTVFPNLDLVIAQNSGPQIRDASGSTASANSEFLKIVIDSIRD